MVSHYDKMQLLGPVIWRLRHSRLRREFHAEVAQTMLSRGSQGPVLDVGSGPGLLAQRLMAVRGGLRVVCVDPEPRMLRAARAAGCRDLVRASADVLPFRSEVFPTVVSTASLKAWVNRFGGLSEMSRVLGPGGHGFVYDFLTVGPGSDPPGFRRRFGLAAELLRRRMGRIMPFSLNDLQALGESLRSAELGVEIGPADKFGAASLFLWKPGT